MSLMKRRITEAVLVATLIVSGLVELTAFAAETAAHWVPTRI